MGVPLFSLLIFDTHTTEITGVDHPHSQFCYGVRRSAISPPPGPYTTIHTTRAAGIDSLVTTTRSSRIFGIGTRVR
jgi:hypothetical protein